MNIQEKMDQTLKMSEEAYLNQAKINYKRIKNSLNTLHDSIRFFLKNENQENFDKIFKEFDNFEDILIDLKPFYDNEMMEYVFGQPLYMILEESDYYKIFYSIIKNKNLLEPIEPKIIEEEFENYKEYLNLKNKEL